MKRLVLVVCFAAVALGAQAGKQYRDFTDTQGRIIRGCVKAYDARKKLVTIERDNRKTARVPITVFSEADQRYIRDWQVAQLFMSVSGFKVDLKKKVIRKWTETGDARRDYEKVIYEVICANRGETPMKNLRIAYNIFYEQEKLFNSGQVTEKECGTGRIPAKGIEGHSKAVFSTKPIVVYAQRLLDGYDGYVGGLPERQRGEVKGIVVRVTLILPSGMKATRVFCSPSDLKSRYAWQEPE